MMKHHHSIGGESLVTGLLGAGAVALWFLVVDTLAGRPFVTPSILGQVILFGQTTPVTETVQWSAVAAYSALHVAAFLVIGAVATQLVFLADRHGIFRFVLLMGFIAFEVFFYGLLNMFFRGTEGLFPMWSVLAANTLAAVVMAWYLVRKHPALRRGMAREPLGAAPDPTYRPPAADDHEPSGMASGRLR